MRSSSILKADGWSEFRLHGGAVQINGQPLNEDDGLAIEEPGLLRLRDAIAAEILLFDMKA